MRLCISPREFSVSSITSGKILTQISKLNLNNFRPEMFKWLATRFEYCVTSSRRALFSLEFIVLFLFKVYTKQSQIRGTLPVSDMELFGTISTGNQRRI